MLALSLIFINFSGRNFVRGADGSYVLEEFQSQLVASVVILEFLENSYTNSIGVKELLE
jgi:hypothetical protein